MSLKKRCIKENCLYFQAIMEFIHDREKYPLVLFVLRYFGIFSAFYVLNNFPVMK
jgi:hypothetical protein